MALVARRYDLDVRISPSPIAAVPDAPGSLDATCDLLISNAGARPVSTVPLLLYRLLHVERATDTRDPGAPVATRQSIRPLYGQSALQVNSVSVRLRTPLDPGAETTLRLTYGGSPVGYREVMPYVHDSVQSNFAVLRPEVLWYPVLGSATPKTYRQAWSVPEASVKIQLPEGWRAFLPPARARSGPDGTDLFTFAGWTQGLHLFAGAFETSQMHVLTVYHLPGRSGWAFGVASAAEFALGELAAWLGPQAMARRDVAFLELPAGWGSQHLPGLIAQTVADDPAAAFAEVVHEVAHFWTPGRDPNRFCDEAIAHYLEDLLCSAKGGTGAWQAAVARRMQALREHPHALSVPLALATESEELDAVSRQKGPLALAVLERGIGRAAVFELLRAWLASPASSEGDAMDFVQHVSKELSQPRNFDTSRFLREWFLGQCTPELALAEPPEFALTQAANRYALAPSAEADRVRS